MRKYIRLAVVALLTAASLETWAQDADSLSVQRDSVAWEHSLSEVSVVGSSTRTEGDKTTVVITKEMRRVGCERLAQIAAGGTYQLVLTDDIDALYSCEGTGTAGRLDDDALQILFLHGTVHRLCLLSPR